MVKGTNNEQKLYNHYLTLAEVHVEDAEKALIKDAQLPFAREYAALLHGSKQARSRVSIQC